MSKLKLLYDHQTFSIQEYGGISRYFSEIMKYYHMSKDLEFCLPVLFSNNVYIEEKLFTDHKHFLKGIDVKGKTRSIENINRLASIYCLLNKKYDIFHPTYYNPYFLRYLNNNPFVITVYDLTQEVYPNLFSSKDKVANYKKELINKANKIIAISHNTKIDLINYYHIEEKKIEVIYLGISLTSEVDAIPNNINLPKNFILYVGNRFSYKNFNFFVESITPLLLKDDSLYVVCAGGGRFTEKEKKLFENLSITNKVLRYDVNDVFLRFLYENARVFVFPSLYEGFGIPILEAFQYGCPLIVSNTSCFPEIAGDAAVLIDPFSKSSIKSSVEKLIYNESIRNTLIKKGYFRIQKYSWENTAKKTKTLYESLY